MSNRTKGEGSLSKKPNGSWLAQATVEGKRVSKVKPTKREAQEWLNTIKGQIKQGLTYASSKTTVEMLLSDWLRLKSSKNRPATNESYNRMARLYIFPNMGSMKLQDLSAARVQKFYSDLEKGGTGKRTIEHVHTVLYGLLGHALNLGLVAQNWAAVVMVPRHDKRELQVWDESQVSQFLLSVEGNPFYRMAFFTGMRRGELIGLQWKDLNWSTGMLTVRRQVYQPEGGGYLFQLPKTENGKRNIKLGPGILESVRIHFNQTIPMMRAVCGDDWQDLDLMFPSSRGTPRDGYTVSKEFHDLVSRSGLPQIRFHDIRHTVASLMLLHGEPAMQVAKKLGQTVKVLLSTYAHFIPDDQERASNLMDEITTPASIFIPEKIQLQPIATKKVEF